MQKDHNNSIFHALLILCLSLALLLAQTNRLHMHLEHDDHSESSERIEHVHTAPIIHDFNLDHHDGAHDDPHPAAIDVSPDNLIKKTNLLNPLALILFFIVLLLYISRRACTVRQKLYKALFAPCYYLLQPPLRAPPVT